MPLNPHQKRVKHRDREKKPQGLRERAAKKPVTLPQHSIAARVRDALGPMYRSEATTEQTETRLALACTGRDLAEFVIDTFNRGWITTFSLGLDDEGRPISGDEGLDRSVLSRIQGALGPLFRSEGTFAEAETSLVEACSQQELAGFLVDAFNRDWITPGGLGLTASGWPV